MDHPLCEIVERCASAVVVAEPGNLPALAQLHTNLLAVVQSAVESAPSTEMDVTTLSDRARRTADQVEKLVLGEAADATAAFADVCKAVEAIQQFVHDAINGRSASPTPIATPTPAAAAPVAAGQPATSEAPAAVAHESAPAEQPIAEADLPLIVDFVGEANAHLAAAEASLLQLEDDRENLDLVNAVFRAFHTIKGVAGFLNLRQIGRLAHVAETLLDLARNGKVLLIGARLDTVLAALDLAKQMITAVDAAAKACQAPATEPALEGMVKRLTEAADLSRSDGSLQTSKTAPMTVEKTAAPAAPVAAASPVAAVAAAPAPAVDALPAVEAAAPARATATAPAAKASAENERAPAATGGSTSEGSVKVATDRLDSLINTVGELVIAQAMVAQNLVAANLTADQRLSRNLSQLGKITRSLQDLSMSMRMIPIQGVFQKMARLVRDVGRKAGKDVQLVQAGGETELDRNVVEAIGDPLVHMVRNAVDHGLEPAADRKAAGKSPTGQVSLKAYHQAGNVIVEVSDDGRGLNKARILKKAIEAGIVREGQDLSEDEIFRLIFHPGLSTAEKITDISGRGVGMDVVKKNVEALRGRIEIASRPGHGSTFTIRLPLTLAVIDGLVVKVGPERYIVPITSIEQSLRPTPTQLSTVQNRAELCQVRDRLLPIVRLHRLFNVEPRTEDPTRSLVVIVQDGTNRCCLLVDELLGQQQVVIKSLGPGMGPISGISGCAILGDGNVSLILDVAGIIHSALN